MKLWDFSIRLYATERFSITLNGDRQFSFGIGFYKSSPTGGLIGAFHINFMVWSMNFYLKRVKK